MKRSCLAAKVGSVYRRRSGDDVARARALRQQVVVLPVGRDGPGDGIDLKRINAIQAHLSSPPELAGQLADYANRKRVPQAMVVETALSSFLAGWLGRMEAGAWRRLDLHQTRERLERTSQFERGVPCSCASGSPSPPLPIRLNRRLSQGRSARGFVEALGRRLAKDGACSPRTSPPTS